MAKGLLDFLLGAAKVARALSQPSPQARRGGSESRPQYQAPPQPEGTRRFYSKVSGISYRNPDGSSRQAIAQCCVPGEALMLRREPFNKHDKNAVAVLRATGEQLGYIPATDRTAKELASAIDRGTRVECEVAEVTGGDPMFGVNLLITVYE